MTTLVVGAKRVYSRQPRAGVRLLFAVIWCCPLAPPPQPAFKCELIVEKNYINVFRLTKDYIFLSPRIIMTLKTHSHTAGIHWQVPAYYTPPVLIGVSATNHLVCVFLGRKKRKRLYFLRDEWCMCLPLSQGTFLKKQLRHIATLVCPGACACA